MARTVALIRTHYFDDTVSTLATWLGAHWGAADVAIVVDEKGGPIDTGVWRKISVSPGRYRELGLLADAPSLMWRCGDYCLYAAREAIPDADFYWLIEPDVRINFDNASQFFGCFNDTTDFLAARFGLTDSSWDWHATMADRHKPVYRCSFPLVRMSGRAIDFLKSCRKTEAALYGTNLQNLARWPNDEVFAATMLANNGFSCADLNAFGKFWDETTFDFWSPIRAQDVETSDVTGKIYHPVLRGSAYFNRLLFVAERQGGLERLERTITELTGTEWTPAEAARHRASLNAARGQPRAVQAKIGRNEQCPCGSGKKYKHCHGRLG